MLSVINKKRTHANFICKYAKNVVPLSHILRNYKNTSYEFI